MISDMTAAEIRMAEEDEMGAQSNIYDYRGRFFQIMLRREDEGWWSDIAELGAEITDADGYTYRERHEWEGSGNFFPNSLAALMEATTAIKQTVDDEMDDAEFEETNTDQNMRDALRTMFSEN